MAFVAQPTNEVLVHTQDYNGKNSTTQYWVANTETDPATGAPAALANGVQGIIAGAVTSVELKIHAVEASPAVAGTGPYDRVQDKALLEFYAADGSIVRFQMPGPRQTTLKADHYTVDPAAALTAALVTALLTDARTAEGLALTALTRGYRRVPPRLKNH